jgi:hypothetical protein
LKFGVDGNAQDFRSQLMGSGATLPGRGWEVLEAGLLVESERIVDFAADTLIGEMLLEGVTASGSQNTEGELIPDMVVVSVGEWEDDLDAIFGGPGLLSVGAMAVKGVGLDDSRD